MRYGLVSRNRSSDLLPNHVAPSTNLSSRYSRALQDYCPLALVGSTPLRVEAAPSEPTPPSDRRPLPEPAPSQAVGTRAARETSQREGRPRIRKALYVAYSDCAPGV